ncbi:MAG TPA: glycoside hydrolase family 2 protein [Polyangia bacterium]|nr:glycoside hydrolase family 2 protein [Polyangia bacterium]
MARFKDWMPAQVPGCVHTDLLRAGKIPDPFVGTNEKDLQWIEKSDWEYRSSFVADESLLARQRVDLVWKGLDTFAEVFVNGVSVLKADNMFRTWRVDVRAKLVKGANAVLVRFRSPIAAVKPAYDKLGYRLPAINDQADEMVSMFARKAPYHYGWDWGPRFVTSGIWRPVTIEAWDEARLDDVQVVQRELTDARARLAFVATIEATRASKLGEQVTFVVTSKDGAAAPVTVSAPVAAGSNRVTVELTIDEPQRWWPNGLGAQKLYGFDVALAAGGQPRGTRAVRVGLRTVEVVHVKDKDGKSFTVKVNGAPTFMKGANYIPPDSFVDRVTPERRRALLRSAAAANMNMLRVWGGGIYEDDAFYDLCDELGILVFQEFMFACSMYPGDDAFVENVRREAVDNVRRLRNHASLALWSGNNEIEAAWAQWGWQWKFHLGKAAQAEIQRGYDRVFREVLPRVVAEEDAGRFYTSSSPSANEPDVPPNKLGWGDNHYWGVWHSEAPYTDYATHVSRFMSEYGFQSFPTLDTVAKYAPPSEWRIDSPVMLSHQRHPRGNQLVRTYMERDFRVPKDFASFLYMSQVSQANVIKFGAEAHRRRWPYNAGSLYWQLDDCWPVASWSGIDYFGRWKALHYAARRFFAPVLVSPVEDGGNVRVYVVNDRRADVRGRLVLRILDLEGKPLWHHEQDVVAPANASAALWSSWKKDLLHGADPTRVVFVAELFENGQTLSRNLFTFVKTRDLELPNPELQVAVEARPTGAVVRVTAKRFARAVYLAAKDVTAPEAAGAFSDNFFDLLPGESVTLDWKAPPGAPSPDAGRLSAALRVISVRDTY